MKKIIIVLFLLIISAAALTAEIPGIMAVDVYGNLEDRGFTITKQIASPGYYYAALYNAGDYEYMATIWCESADVVTKIEATALTFDPATIKKVAAPYFAFLATLPYNGADPEKAAQWVKNNLEGGDTVIGGVGFNIFKMPSSIRLTIYK